MTVAQMLNRMSAGEFERHLLLEQARAQQRENTEGG
jgi:hypothetical protein